MMDDREIEALLQKYRPADPPAELRASIRQLASPPVRQATWPWVVAAGALLAVAITLHGTATAPTVQTAAPSASQLADGLGGGMAGHAMADFILSSPATAGRSAADDDPWSNVQ